MKAFIQVLLDFITIIILLSYGLACIAQNIPVNNLGIPHFLGLFFIYLFFGVILLGILNFFRKRKILALVQALIILVTISIWCRQIGISIPGTPKTSDKSISVFSYNCKSFSGLDQKEHFVEFSDWLRDFENPDIFVLQELTKDEAKKISNQLEVYHNNLKEKFISGIITGVYSRFPIVNIEALNFKDDEGSSNRNFVMDIAYPQDTIRIIACHFRSNNLTNHMNQMLQEFNESDNSTLKMRMENILKRYFLNSRMRMDDLQVVLPYIEKSPYPVVLAGDLNEIPYSPLYKELNASMVDGFCKKGLGVATTLREPLPGLKIDYIFHSPSIKTIKQSVLNLPFSDHKAIYSALEIK